MEEEEAEVDEEEEEKEEKEEDEDEDGRLLSTRKRAAKEEGTGKRKGGAKGSVS